LASICEGTGVSATFTAGSGGVGCSDDYLLIVDGGIPVAYTEGSTVGATATTSIEIQGRRAGCTSGAGCTGTSYTTLASWSVVAQPTGPTLNAKTPNLASICEGTGVSATFTAGSGGVGCSDDYLLIIDGGIPVAYTEGSTVGATATTSIEIQGRRAGCTSGAGCTGTSYTTLASWSVGAYPSPPSTIGGQICIGSNATLSASGAIAGQVYRWYSASSGGTLLKTSSNHTDNTYTTPTISSTTNYWVAIVSNIGCVSSRTQVTATFPTSSPDDQNTSGTNSWIGHVYDAINFTTYYGNYTLTETFDENFGGATSCFSINSSLGSRFIHTTSFSVHYRMNSTKRGLYVVNLGSDDGSRLYVDGILLYNNWADQGFGSRPRVLMSLNGASSLVYDFYENGGQNRVVFQTLTLVLANTLSVNTSQSVCLGSSGSAISGDAYGTLPAGISLSGTGYQWAYSSSSTGPWTDITGATSATYSPSTVAAPFNSAGTYYIIRKAILSSANNVAPNPYVATNESNAATLIVNSLPSALSLSGSTICSSPGNNGTITSTTSVSGVNYQLYNSSNITVQTAKAGTGSALEWSGLGGGTGYYVLGTDGNSCVSPSSNLVDVSTITISATVDSIFSPECPLLTDGFEPDGSDLGYSYVTFKVSRSGSSTASWDFDFNVSGATDMSIISTPTYTTWNGTNGTYTGLAVSDIDISVRFKNIENTFIDVVFEVTEISDADGCSDITPLSDNSSLLPMPALGPFE
jgi:hypothetical protein